MLKQVCFIPERWWKWWLGKVKEYQLNLVVDPVLVAGSGGTLSRDDLAKSLKKTPFATGKVNHTQCP